MLKETPADDGLRNLHFGETVLGLRSHLVYPRSNSSLPTFIGEAGQDADDPTTDSQAHVILRLILTGSLPHLEHVQVERARLEVPRKEGGEGYNRAQAREDRVGDGLDWGLGWTVEIEVRSTSHHQFLA
jgi:hypothetical protein